MVGAQEHLAARLLGTATCVAGHALDDRLDRGAHFRRVDTLDTIDDVREAERVVARGQAV
jgi:hypothetical protein